MVSPVIAAVIAVVAGVVAAAIAFFAGVVAAEVHDVVPSDTHTGGITAHVLAEETFVEVVEMCIRDRSLS